uniref:Uncharacterized protein n=1 Tax=Romanomermis culicivorax TaxID=13658 RepID=A0A915IPK5_ROMCU
MVALDQKEQLEFAEKSSSSYFSSNQSKSFASSIRRDSGDKTPTKEDQKNLRSTKEMMQPNNNLSPHSNRSLAKTLKNLSKLSQS